MISKHVGQYKKFCEECGEGIANERLAILPATIVCVRCQSSLEKAGKFEKHRMAHHIKFKGDEIEDMQSYVVRARERS